MKMLHNIDMYINVLQYKQSIFPYLYVFVSLLHKLRYFCCPPDETNYTDSNLAS